MGATLNDIPERAICALAPILNLSPDDISQASHQGRRARPSLRWRIIQKARTAQLPACLLLPPIPLSVGIRVEQTLKKMYMAATGGFDNVAAYAASRGRRLDAVLDPRNTPTALCPAHRKLHPDLMHEIFYYLSREIADHADPARHHLPHGNDGLASHSGACRSPAVREWGYRMLELSTLWCDPLTFRNLEQKRLASLPAAHSQSSSPKGSRLLQPASSSASSSASHYQSIPRSSCLLHLDFPCEACVLAAVGGQGQALVDLRASLLSRLALRACNKRSKHRRRDKSSSSGKGRHEQRHKDNTAANPPDNTKYGADAAAGDGDFECLLAASPGKRFPHLCKVVEAYIDVFPKETAAEMRRQSEVLGRELFAVRQCEAHRCRAEKERETKNKRRHDRRRHDKVPQRMVTRYGHRLPLPPLPLKHEDLWAFPNGMTELSGPDAPRTDTSDEIDQLWQQLEYIKEDDCTRGFDCVQVDAIDMGTAPEWEEAYRRLVLDSQSILSSGQQVTSKAGDISSIGNGARGAAGTSPEAVIDRNSYITINVHAETPSGVQNQNRHFAFPPPLHCPFPSIPSTPTAPSPSKIPRRGTPSIQSLQRAVAFPSPAPIANIRQDKPTAKLRPLSLLTTGTKIPVRAHGDRPSVRSPTARKPPAPNTYIAQQAGLAAEFGIDHDSVAVGSSSSVYSSTGNEGHNESYGIDTSIAPPQEFRSPTPEKPIWRGLLEKKRAREREHERAFLRLNGRVETPFKLTGNVEGEAKDGTKATFPLIHDGLPSNSKNSSENSSDGICAIRPLVLKPTRYEPDCRPPPPPPPPQPETSSLSSRPAAARPMKSSRPPKAPSQVQQSSTAVNRAPAPPPRPPRPPASLLRQLPPLPSLAPPRPPPRAKPPTLRAAAYVPPKRDAPHRRNRQTTPPRPSLTVQPQSPARPPQPRPGSTSTCETVWPIVFG